MSVNHGWDFEARCEVCGKNLTMFVKRAKKSDTFRGLLLRPDECPDHPGKSMILWPQRDDIVNDYSKEPSESG